MTKKKGKIPVQKGPVKATQKTIKFETPSVRAMDDTEDAIKNRSGKMMKKTSRGGY